MLVEGVLGGVAGLVRHPQPFMRLMVSFFWGGGAAALPFCSRDGGVQSGLRAGLFFVLVL